MSRLAVTLALLAALGSWRLSNCSAQTNLTGIWTGTSFHPNCPITNAWELNVHQSGNNLWGTAFFVPVTSSSFISMSFTGIVSGSVVWIESQDVGLPGYISLYGTESNFVWTGGISQPYCITDNTLGTFTFTRYGPPFPGPVAGFTTAVTMGTNVILNGTGGVLGKTYYVLSSTNAAAPVSTWTPVMTNSFGGSDFSITSAILPSVPGLFFTIRAP